MSLRLAPHFESQPLAANDDLPLIDSKLGFRIIDSQTGLKAIFEAISELGENEGVVLKMQTWRGDKVGLKATNACEEALGRGADVTLLKDEIGQIFEEGERAGVSLWPSEKFSSLLSWQGSRLISFYKNSRDAFVDEDHNYTDESADARLRLQGYSNFTLDTGYRYDHSKVVIIYDKKTQQPTKAFVGGACFGDEWGNEVLEQNFDGVMEITDPQILKQIVQSLKGAPNNWENGVRFLTNQQSQPESYYHTIREEVGKFSGSVEAAIAYMGKADLIKLFEGKESAKIIMPFEANINRDRNWHFIYEMMRRTEKDFSSGLSGRLKDGRLLSYWWDFMDKTNQSLPEDMQVVALDRMSHLKAIVCGQAFASIGSANMVGENSFNEAGLAFAAGTDKGDFGIQQTQFLMRRAQSHSYNKTGLRGVGINYINSELSASPEVPRFSLVRSQFEHASMAFQAIMAALRKKDIARVQAKERALFCELFPDV